MQNTMQKTHHYVYNETLIVIILLATTTHYITSETGHRGFGFVKFSGRQKNLRMK